MEWNWVYPDSLNYSYPYSIQITKDLYLRITGVEKKTTSRDLREKKEKEEAEQDTQNIYQNQVHMLQIGYNQQQPSNSFMNNGMSSGMQNNNPVGNGFNFYN